MSTVEVREDAGAGMWRGMVPSRHTARRGAPSAICPRSMSDPGEPEMSASDPRDPVTPRAASAVVLLRDGAEGGAEVFLVRRHVRSEFVPDAFVFPGGTVKPGDIEAERAPDLCEPVHMGGRTALGFGFRAAAIRECFEEAGVLIARRGAAPVAIGAADVAQIGRASCRERVWGGGVGS